MVLGDGTQISLDSSCVLIALSQIITLLLRQVFLPKSGVSRIIVTKVRKVVVTIFILI